MSVAQQPALPHHDHHHHHRFTAFLHALFHHHSHNPNSSVIAPSSSSPSSSHGRFLSAFGTFLHTLLHHHTHNPNSSAIAPSPPSPSCSHDGSSLSSSYDSSSAELYDPSSSVTTPSPSSSSHGFLSTFLHALPHSHIHTNSSSSVIAPSPSSCHGSSSAVDDPCFSVSAPSSFLPSSSHGFFSKVGTFLHALHHHHTHNPSSFHGSSSVIHAVVHALHLHTHNSSSSSHSSERRTLYRDFESQLAHRLSTLLPSNGSPSVSLSSLKQLMGLLIDTETDLQTLFPTSHTHTKSMEEFLERSIKLLDVCRGINEQILELQSSQATFQLVASCLNSDNGDLRHDKVDRARKALAQLVHHMDVEREDHTDHMQTGHHRSFRKRIWEHLSGHGFHESSSQRLQRNHSASSSSHGSQGSASSSSHACGDNVSTLGNVSTHGNHVTVPSEHRKHGAHLATGSAAAHARDNAGSQVLHTEVLNLSSPRLHHLEPEEEYFCAAMYALDAVSIFSLGTISAALPSTASKTYCTGDIHLPHAAKWTSPFVRVRKKVDEELRKHGGHAGMWELDQISLLAKRLLELTLHDDYVSLGDNREEVQKAVKMFCQHVEELKRDMGALQSQMNEFYSRIVVVGIRVLDLLRDVEQSVANCLSHACEV